MTACLASRGGRRHLGRETLNDFILARVTHVLAVLLRIGGVAFVTQVIHRRMQASMVTTAGAVGRSPGLW